MHPTLLIGVLIFSLLLAVAYVWYMVESVLNSAPLRIGYVPTNGDACIPLIRDVVDRYMPRTSAARFIEPGCGLVHVSQAMAAAYKWDRVVALDLRFSLVALARVRNLRASLPITFLRQNILDYDYGKGNVIYCYLSTPLLEKLHVEGKLAGNLVLSLSFAIPGVASTEELPVFGWQKRMYVYDFR